MPSSTQKHLDKKGGRPVEGREVWGRKQLVDNSVGVDVLYYVGC